MGKRSHFSSPNPESLLRTKVLENTTIRGTLYHPCGSNRIQNAIATWREKTLPCKDELNLEGIYTSMKVVADRLLVAFLRMREVVKQCGRCPELTYVEII
eukprot:19068-Amphidinium_carterae.1